MTRDESPLRLLILGGTTEASGLGAALAGRSDVAPLLSLAGRTAQPARPAIPHRVGGFGGIAGLVEFLRASEIKAVVDATHPFAARISANAAAACCASGVPLARFTRPAWAPSTGDRWLSVPDIDTAVATLCGLKPELKGGRLRVFLTTGRLDLAQFKAAPQHRYLIRTIDPPDPAVLPPDHVAILGRGPFDVAAEEGLMREHRVEVLVTKNSGGEASAAKLFAARRLGVPVVMVERPASSDAIAFDDLASTLAWIDAQPRRP